MKEEETMDKELMDKINEMLKAQGRQALNMDEAEQVVGGSTAVSSGPIPGTVIWNDKVLTKTEFNNTWMSITANFGFDIAKILFVEATGFVCTETNQQYNFSAKDTDNDKMGIILDRFWRTFD